ncbi:glycoside hydrolase family 78 protein [Paenibacillus herberti]|nr:glycoside hydrolase family 78 protein [Paenibacillus herberti]
MMKAITIARKAREELNAVTLTVKGLTCEYRKQPLGIDTVHPRFSWKLESTERGALQTGYRLQVTTTQDGFEKPLWDTGQITNGDSIQIPYEGPALRSRTRYYYRIQVWDNNGQPSPWSETDWWETALLFADEWQAEWISADPLLHDPDDEASPLLRKEFEVVGEIASARLYATAAGVYEIHLNGRRVGEDLMTPGWTSYSDRLQYQTYDVTEELRQGANALGASLGSGWYKGELVWENSKNHYGNVRALLLQLHIIRTDGSEQFITSNPSWKVSTGALLASEIYHGEVYDARLEPRGWHKPGFDDSAWSSAVEIVPGVGKLVAQENLPVRVTERISPVSLIQTPNGETVLDYGQNLVGRIRLQLDLPAGTTITLYHAEILDRDGNFYTGNLRSAKQMLTYTSAGNAKESYAAAFSFYGFRYVKLEGYPGQELGEVSLEGFVAEVMHTDMPETGRFECSSGLINQLFSNIQWGQRGNFLDVPTDCPQRNERLGWTGDAQVFVRTAAFNYDVGLFFAKWLRDLRADQQPDGGVPFIIPDVLHQHSSSAWGDAAVICPWTIYQCYGDKRMLEEQFDSMKAWVEYIRRQGEDEYLWNTGFHFGDWLGLDAKEGSYVGATPSDLIATAFYAYSASLVRDAAVVLGKATEAKRYAELAERVRAAFSREFITPGGRLAAPTQTAHALVLAFGLVEGSARERTAKELNKLVTNQEFHLTTGFVGTPYLCFALSDNGYHETALKLLLQESYPSWLYSVNKGATTIWEHWDGVKPDGTFWSDDMNSYNHYAYGAIGEWMYRRVAGIDMDESQPAYRAIRIEPLFGGEKLTYAKAELDSPYGLIRSEWRRESGKLGLEIEVPVNTTATVRLPVADAGSILESGLPIGEAGGIELMESEEGFISVRVGSGCYSFVLKDEALAAEVQSVS